ncbi:hypothetical protein AB0F15_38520 [Amycolatopsis sp. NPDC026612]|uniref:hypothetical protein n=1 Tax=Amycolatopsis sp. NPDC026612 TaxID=3155466 RepID=UPI0033E9754A
MGIFGTSEKTAFVDHENVVVDAGITARLPDAGAFLLDALDFLGEPALRATEAAIAGLRNSDGAIPGSRLREIGIRDWKRGPLTHLAWLTAKDAIAVEVWASFGLGHRDAKRIGTTAQQVYLTQGMPAAAAWAVQSRPGGRLDLDFLAEQLRDNWSESLGRIRNGDIIKSFKKWTV